MNTLTLTLYLTLGLVGIYFVLMSVRLIFLKNGEFKGTCASQSPFLRTEGVTCNYCGKDLGSCDSENESEVDKVMTKAN